MALQCNLCKEWFVANSRFERFCGDCRSGSELFHFYEWVPKLHEDEDLVVREGMAPEFFEKGAA